MIGVFDSGSGSLTVMRLASIVWRTLLLSRTNFRGLKPY
jgi:hypothetical protein